MNKRIRVTVVFVVLLLVTALTAVRAQDAKPFRVAAVAPSAKNDLAFSQSMFDALTAVQTEMGEDKFQFDFQDGTFIQEDAEAAMRDWASSGNYDLIIAHGSQFGSNVENVAKDFPDISFAWGTDVNTFDLPNVFAYTVAADEGGIVKRTLAALMSKSGIIGVVGPIEVGDAKAYVDGFVKGATATKPDITVNVTYTGDFGNVSLATEAAKALVANGADILTGTAQLVVGPIAVAQENGLKWFGSQANQSSLAGATGVMYQVYHWEVALKDMITSIQGGTLGGTAFTLNLQNGGIVMET